MKSTIDQLRNEASIYCIHRGHVIQWEASFFHEWSNANLQNGICIHCQKEVQINDNPQPNGIDIGGEAVATNCNHH